MWILIQIVAGIPGADVLDNLLRGGGDRSYLIAGAVIFCICGFLTGFFIWRRSTLLYAEMRHEKKRSLAALETFRKEVESEKKMLDEAGKTTLAVSGKGSRKKKKKKKKKKGKRQTVAHSDKPVDETVSIKVPENPVARAMRMEDPGRKAKSKDSKGKKKDEVDDLFS